MTRLVLFVLFELFVTKLPPNSARFSYATEGALFISVQLSAYAVSAPPKGLGTDNYDCTSNLAPKYARKHEGKKKKKKKKGGVHLDSNDFGFI